MSTGAIVMDERLWPLVLFTLGDDAEEADWLAVFDAYERLYRRGQRFAVINDGSRLRSVPSAATRKAIAARTKEHEPMSREWVLCSSVIVTNTVVRGALTALNWISKPVYSQHYVDSMAEALRVSLRAFEAEGISLDARIAGELRERVSLPRS